MDQDAMLVWADLSDDHNRLHVDPEYAKSTRYGGTIVHGHFTLTWIMQLAQEWFGDAWLFRGQIRGLRFLQPLRPDVTYSVTGVDEPDGSIALTILLPDGEPGLTATLSLRPSP